MRLLIIHQAFASSNQPGGTRHLELARHLVRRGHQVTIIASDVDYLTGRRLRSPRGQFFAEHVDGVRVLRAPMLPALHRGFGWRTASFLSFLPTATWAGLLAGPVDVVMGTSPPLPQALVAWAVAALRRRPFLLEIRDLWPEFAIDIGVLRDPTLIALSRRLVSFLYTHATHFLVNSPAYRDYLKTQGLAPARITLIPNGVDVAAFNPFARGELLRRTWGIKDGDFVVMYAGALGLANDIPTILRAAHRLLPNTNIRFLLVGDGKERPNLESLARSMGLTNVTFVGARPKRDMPDVLAASDACVATLKDIPMFRTTYPNKVFDYMAAGRPIILGIDGVIRQVVEAAGGGVFVPPGDDAALAAAVQQLSADAEICRAMGQAARAYVEKYFDRQQQALDFEALLLQLAAR